MLNKFKGILAGICGLILCSCSNEPDPSDFRQKQETQLQQRASMLLDQASSQTNAIEATEMQRELIHLGQQAPDGIETITAVMEERVSNDPKDLITANLLKEIYLRELREPNKAAELYEKLLKADPGNTTLKQELVGLYQAAERYNDVAELYRHEIGMGSGNDAWLTFQVASHMIYAGNTDAGLAYAQEQFGATPSAENEERMSRLYETASRWDEAAVELNKAIQSATNSQYAVNMSIHLGELYIRSQQYDQALIHLQNLKETANVSPQQKSIVNEQIFRIYKRQGRLSELKIETVVK